MLPPPVSGDWNSHPELSAWEIVAHVTDACVRVSLCVSCDVNSHHMSVIRVIILHPCTKIEGLSVPNIWLIFGHDVKWPGDLGTGAEC